jgi:hypothetical protein
MFPVQRPEPCYSPACKTNRGCSFTFSTSSASDTEQPQSFSDIEAENRFPSHHHAQKCIRAGQMLFAYFALFANPVNTIFMPQNSKFSFGSY